MEGRSEAAVSVMDENTRWLTIPTASLDDLLSRPLACRVACGSDVHDLPTDVMNDEKDIDCSEEDRLNAEEVAGPDFTGMRGEKITPARRWRSSMDASHVLRNGPGGDRDTQSCQLCLDPALPTPPGSSALAPITAILPATATLTPNKSLAVGSGLFRVVIKAPVTVSIPKTHLKKPPSTRPIPLVPLKSCGGRE